MRINLETAAKVRRNETQFRLPSTALHSQENQENCKKEEGFVFLDTEDQEIGDQSPS